MKMKGFVALTLLLTSHLVQLSADESVFTTFGPGGEYNPTDAAVAAGVGAANGYFTSGFSFTPSTTARLTSIDIPLGLVSGVNALDLELRLANGSGGTPGTLLEHFDVDGRMPIVSGTMVAPLSVRSFYAPAVVFGETYWLVASAEGTTFAHWNVNNQGLRGDFHSIQGGVEVVLPNQLMGAFRINGLAIAPEPSTTALLTLGLGLLAVRVSRRAIGRDAR